MDNNIFSSLNFWDETVNDKCEYTNDFTIMQQSGYSLAIDTIKTKSILMTVSISMDSLKIQTVVTSYKFMDMMGELGGFMEILFLILSFFGS